MIIFVVLDGTSRASSVRTSWGFAFVSLEAVLACIAKCAKYMRPCVVSKTTLLFFIKCKPMIDPVIFFITMKCSPNVLSPKTNFSVNVTDGFSNWPIAILFENWEVCWFWGFHSVLAVLSCPIPSERSQWHRLLNLPGDRLLEYSWNPEAHTTFPFCVLGLR